jgi:hypothetical protein
VNCSSALWGTTSTKTSPAIRLICRGAASFTRLFWFRYRIEPSGRTARRRSPAVVETSSPIDSGLARAELAGRARGTSRSPPLYLPPASGPDTEGGALADTPSEIRPPVASPVPMRNTKRAGFLKNTGFGRGAMLFMIGPR